MGKSSILLINIVQLSMGVMGLITKKVNKKGVTNKATFTKFTEE
jgi:hypothetical protein